MKPFLLRSIIRGGVAFLPGEGISIDGPLAYACVAEYSPEKLASCPSPVLIHEQTIFPGARLPLSVFGDPEGIWLYQCSLGKLIDHHGTEQTHWVKRFDQDMASCCHDQIKIRKKINIGSGEFKAYYMPCFRELVEAIEWRCVGDPEEAIRLLRRHIRGIGSKVGSGVGRVYHWEVEALPEPEAESWLWRSPGELARPVPVELLPPDFIGDVQIRGYRAPYWLTSRHTVCGVPGQGTDGHRADGSPRQVTRAPDVASSVTPGQGVSTGRSSA